jgi:hypothetical protein
MDKMQNFMKSKLDNNNDPYLEECWGGRKKSRNLKQSETWDHYRKIANENDYFKGVPKVIQ